MVKIIKTDSPGGIVIENNLYRNIDNLEHIISCIMLDNGIDKIEYKDFPMALDKENKLILKVSRSLLERDKDKISRIAAIVSNIVSRCDSDNNFIEVEVSPKGLSSLFPPLNTIELSDELIENYNFFENESLNVIDIKSGQVKSCCVRFNKELKGCTIALNPSNREIFINSGKVFIQRRSHIQFTRVNVQKVDKIFDGIITISEEYRDWIDTNKITDFELINEITGSSMDINLNQIEFSNIDKNQIKLSYFQRLVLDTDLPPKISHSYFEKFKDKLEKEKEKLELLKKYFENEKALTSEIIREETDVYNHKRKIKDLLQGYPVLSLYALPKDSISKGNILSRLADGALNLIIGSNKINLKCIRPYETDESSNVVRMSKSTMDLLGLDETDNVIISYRNKKEKARALVINEVQCIKETNIFQSESELNVCIGIPAYIRSRLGINKINVCCSVERDKKYLFKKNLNVQFISMIATILTVKQTFSDNRLVIILLLLLLPLSMYVILSSVRNRIKNK